MKSRSRSSSWFWRRLTVDGRLAGQDDHHQLQTLVGVLEVAEHGLHAVRPLGVLAEAGLTLNGHPSVPGDLPQLVRERSRTSRVLRHAHHGPEGGAGGGAKLT